MRILNLLLLVSLELSTICSQALYAQLNHTDFRDYKPFHQTIEPKTFDASILNACIFFATNEVRVKHKLPPLKYHLALEASSTIHSKDMAELDFFNHSNKKIKNHREPEDRAREAGITNPHIAENIIEGFVLNYQSGKEVIADSPGKFIDAKTKEPLDTLTYLELTDNLIEMWMNSEGHRANILSSKAIELGCGTALYYMKNFNDMPAVKATQNFQWFEYVVMKRD
jgi:uncharacterized protein YkwD